jgi:hypothetical protein
MRHSWTMLFYAFTLLFLGVIALSTFPLGFISSISAALGGIPAVDFTTKIVQVLGILTIVGPAIFLGAAVGAAFESRRVDD